jgi:hypothetical protein
MLIGVKLQMLFLVAGVEYKIMRHGRWILHVLNHGEEFGGQGGRV